MTTLPSSFISASRAARGGSGRLRRSCAGLALCAASLACTGDGDTGDEQQEPCSSENVVDDIDDGVGTPDPADEAQLSD